MWLKKQNHNSDKVLVAIINSHHDFSIARDQHWYRIPVDSAEKFLHQTWPPAWLAFYHPKAFKDIAYSVRYVARVKNISRAERAELFPELAAAQDATKLYFKLAIGSIKPLKRPIYSRRRRRIVFIPTTMEKLRNAFEINDLYHGSPLEDRLWAALQHLNIPAERQDLVKAGGKNYFLDFALYCAKGKLNIETDGDRWHHSPELAPKDNLRNNNLVAAGWHILRFTADQILHQMGKYCVPQIVEKINHLGGIEIGADRFRRVDLQAPGSTFQLGLFDA